MNEPIETATPGEKFARHNALALTCAARSAVTGSTPRYEAVRYALSLGSPVQVHLNPPPLQRIRYWHDKTTAKRASIMWCGWVSTASLIMGAPTLAIRGLRYSRVLQRVPLRFRSLGVVLQAESAGLLQRLTIRPVFRRLPLRHTSVRSAVYSLRFPRSAISRLLPSEIGLPIRWGPPTCPGHGWPAERFLAAVQAEPSAPTQPCMNRNRNQIGAGLGPTEPRVPAAQDR
jgi:hypothetical protein